MKISVVFWHRTLDHQLGPRIELDQLPRHGEHVLVDKIRYTVDRVEWRPLFDDKIADVRIYLAFLMEDSRG